MNVLDAARIIARETTTPVVRIPAFAGLPDELQRELQGILAPFVARNVPMAQDPVLPETVALELEGRLFRVSVVTDRKTGGVSIALLGPNLEPWTRDMLEALLPDAAPEPEEVPIRLSPPPPIQRPQAQILEAILEELQANRAMQREILSCLIRMAKP